MERTLIQKHSTAIVRALIERVGALSDLEHKLTKGELRELFVSNILASFLTNQFSVGSGIIINSTGDESKQTDIIIYDNRVLPPFIKEQNVGVYPVESVIATIEIKSWFRKPELLSAEKSAKKLREEICNPEIIAGFKNKRLLPLCAVIGFYGNGVKGLSHKSGKEWLNENIEHLFAICLVKKYSWMQVIEPSWRLINYEKETNEETKRFIAVLIDNIRTLSINRFIPLMDGMHQDWLSAYIRK